MILVSAHNCGGGAIMIMVIIFIMLEIAIMIGATIVMIPVSMLILWQACDECVHDFGECDHDSVDHYHYLEIVLRTRMFQFQ
jgi:hypothetical protein